MELGLVRQRALDAGDVSVQILATARDLGAVHPEAEARVRGLFDQSTRVSETTPGLGKREF